MKRYLALSLAALLLAASCAPGLAAPPRSDADAVFAEIDEIMAELSKITGLEQRRKVDFARLSRDEVEDFLRKRAEEAIKPEEIRAEEAVLKKFGLVPPDFDLKKTTIELLTEQAAAFYDYRKKKMFVVGADSGLIQHSALVHELAHALADQHFNLEKYIRGSAKSDDGSMARLAVMEGQATWLMSEYLTQRTGQSLLDEPVLLKLMARSTEVSTGQYPVFDRAPLYLRETLLFPYAQGMLFQHALLEKMGKAGFAEVFRRPPASTQQILHPEKYFEGAAPARPPLPAFSSRGYRRYAEGDIGQLDHAVLLRQYAGEEESDSLAPEWRGGHYRLMEHRKDKRTVLLYASDWSGPEAARRFFELYPKVLEGKWNTFQIESHSPGVMTGRGDDGWFVLRLEGARVSSTEGLDTPAGGSR